MQKGKEGRRKGRRERSGEVMTNVAANVHGRLVCRQDQPSVERIASTRCASGSGRKCSMQMSMRRRKGHVGNDRVKMSCVASSDVTSALVSASVSLDLPQYFPLEMMDSTMYDEIISSDLLAPLAMIVIILFGELLPLFPTQPLAIACGVLLGGVNGGAVALTGNCQSIPF